MQSPAQMPEDLVSGLEAWYATACTQCDAGEGIIVRIIEGRAIKIEGNPDHPVSQGKTSVRCQAGLQALYNPDRLTGPMRRTGERGSGQFQPVSWDEALNQLTGNLQSQNQDSVVMVTEPLTGSLGMVAQRFLDTIDGQHMAHEAMEQTVLRAAVKQVFGQDQLPEFDIARADYVLSFGADFLSTWLSPVHYSRAYGQFRQGNQARGTLVQVEPRFSMTAANADRWVYVKPGMEGVLALSIAYVLMSEHAGQIDLAAADTMTGGNRETALQAFAPDTIASSVGVSGDQIRQLALQLVEHERSLIIGGGSTAAHTSGLDSLSAIYSLNYLVGSVDKEGGVTFNPDSPLQGVSATPSVASFAGWESLVERMRAGSVKLLLVHGANPVYGLPASVDFAGALRQVDTIVSFSSFMDETTAMADLILPDHVYLEAWGDHIPDPGPGYEAVTLQQPVVYPFQQNPGTRAFGDVLLQVAQWRDGQGQLMFPQLSRALPWITMKDVLRDSAQKLQALGRGSVQAGDFEAFWNTVLQRGGWWDVNAKGFPKAANPPPALTQPMTPEFAGTMNEYPFYLVPFSSLSLTDGKGANLPWLQATPDPVTTVVWHTWAEINTKTAADLDIKEGDELEVESPYGTIKVLAYPHPAAAPEVISIPTGQGHTVYGNFEVGPDMFRSIVGKDRGSNVFSLLAPSKDKATGSLAWAATRVKVRKTGEWTRLSKFEGTVSPIFPEEVIPITRPES